ncbi:hypothetical protein DH2020_015878 [Rehmannia glutinosa]|uniref:Peptidase S54 rhomboid domain-containing protein n=1 Tax=Rehmannia glutinosa TaxID=99300 RepID=A0ABR0WWH1_REHGL
MVETAARERERRKARRVREAGPTQQLRGDLPAGRRRHGGGLHDLTRRRAAEVRGLQPREAADGDPLVPVGPQKITLEKSSGCTSSIVHVAKDEWDNEDKIYMATVASSHSFFCTDNNLLVAKGKRKHAPYDAIIPQIKRNTRKGEIGSTLEDITIGASLLREHKGLRHPFVNKSPHKGKFCTVINALSSTDKHLKSLNSYLVKLHDDSKKPSSKVLNQRTESIGKSEKCKPDYGIRSLEKYLDKVKDVKPENHVNIDLQASIDASAKNDQGNRSERSLKNYIELKPVVAEDKEKSAVEASDFYLIGVLLSINIAVFLFEIATPVKSSDFELFSLPMVYGAKINNLILTGEWWRLVTPIFLHWGIFHIALGSWVLFTFGLEVSREYGSFTFLLIYVLGGISGNLISFLHTPEPTVGGTGPVFAIIGAWLIYQVQNKDVIARDASERLFQNAIITTALSFVLSNFGPIDDWSHFAAMFTGIAYGFVTCPTLQVKDASSESGRQERMTLVRRYADPCKSLMYFSLFILLLSSLLFVIEPPLDLIE